MKREIKIRAWHIKEKRFIDLNGVDILFNGCANVGAIYNIYEQGVLKCFEPDEIDLLEFTGLHDKNGVEIYEGDIVNCHDHPTNIESGIFEINFHSGAFVCNGSALLLRDFGTAWTEIIGNKFENPELITK